MNQVDLTNQIEEQWTVMAYLKSFTSDVREWLNINTHGRWALWGFSGVPACLLYFEFEQDATAFKLRWI